LNFNSQVQISPENQFFKHLSSEIVRKRKQVVENQLNYVKNIKIAQFQNPSHIQNHSYRVDGQGAQITILQRIIILKTVIHANQCFEW
jgi:hypothetical protein